MGKGNRTIIDGVVQPDINSVGGSNLSSNVFDGVETWSAITGLSEATPIKIELDFTDVTKGYAEVIVDGSIEYLVLAGEKSSRIISASSSVTIKSYAGSDVLDLSQITYLSETTIPTTANPQYGFYISPDGLNAFMLIGGDIEGFTFSSAYDATSITDGNDLEPTNTITAFFFKYDGTEVYTVEISGSSRYLRQRTLSTPWDLSSVGSATTVNLTNSLSYNCFWFKPDGSAFFIVENGTKDVLKYSLPTKWNISGAVLSQTFTDAINSGNYVDGWWIDELGTVLLYNMSYQPTVIRKKEFGTPWDFDTLSADLETSTLSEMQYAYCPWVTPARNKIIVAGADTHIINEYDTTDDAGFDGEGYSVVNY